MQEPWLQHRQKEEDLRSPRSNSEILVYWAAPSGRWMREFSWHIESLAPIWGEKEAGGGWGGGGVGGRWGQRRRLQRRRERGNHNKGPGVRGLTCSGFTITPRSRAGHHQGCWWAHSSVCIFAVRGLSRVCSSLKPRPNLLKCHSSPQRIYHHNTSRVRKHFHSCSHLFSPPLPIWYLKNMVALRGDV